MERLGFLLTILTLNVYGSNIPDPIIFARNKHLIIFNQISCWEKTLTTTSLLLWNYLLKPAPFCIFKEVGAQLVDSNFDKLNQIIRKIST